MWGLFLLELTSLLENVICQAKVARDNYYAGSVHDTKIHSPLPWHHKELSSATFSCLQN